MIFQIAPGRRMRWSPIWSVEEASVLFDSASGDFWVVDAPSRDLLRQIEYASGLSVDAVLAQGAWQTQELHDAVASLVSAGVLTQESEPRPQPQPRPQ